MLRHRLWDKLANYSGPYGMASKADLNDIQVHPLDQRIFKSDDSFAEAFKEGATSYITDGARGYRTERDMNMDLKNPRQELPKDKPGLQTMNTIPLLIDQKIDMATPADYEASNAVRLFQQSELNARYQESMFTDPQAMQKNPALSGDQRMSQATKGLSQEEFYGMEGSAAGRPNNFLYMDQDGNYLSSVENIVAF